MSVASRRDGLLLKSTGLDLNIEEKEFWSSRKVIVPKKLTAVVPLPLLRPRKWLILGVELEGSGSLDGGVAVDW